MKSLKKHLVTSNTMSKAVKLCIQTQLTAGRQPPGYSRWCAHSRAMGSGTECTSQLAGSQGTTWRQESHADWWSSGKIRRRRPTPQGPTHVVVTPGNYNTQPQQQQLLLLLLLQLLMSGSEDIEAIMDSCRCVVVTPGNYNSNKYDSRWSIYLCQCFPHAINISAKC